MNSENSLPAQENQTAEVVSQIVAETGRRFSKKIDVRELAGEIHRFLRSRRLSGFEQATVRARLLKFRMRPRQLPIAECRVVDTQTDHDRKRLYFELSNGQIVRADRHRQKLSQPLYGTRRSRWHNPLIRDLVAAEVEKNAKRAA